MTTRLLSLPLLLAVASPLVVSTGCPRDEPGVGDDREPYVDDWRTELSGPAAQIKSLSIGDRLTSDNFANRGDIEVRYVDGTDQITIEMQRFTIAKDQATADAAFERMKFWAYDIATPAAPTPDDAADACWAPEVEGCYVRNYYEGQLQPVRDGVNFRITIPRGWDGDLAVTTEDNLEEGIESYPDRSDIIVDGLAGNLAADLDSGNIRVRMDAATDHYAGCSSNDTCVEMGYPIGCGCTDPTNVTIANNTGQASNITVDVGNPDAWYTMVLENHGSFSAGDEFVCTATIDCDAFPNCEIDPDYATIEYQERAEVNFPGEPAIRGAGIRLALSSEACANITYTEGPDDYEAETFPAEKRGDLQVCVGCLAPGFE
jgi:hypothetical protein